MDELGNGGIILIKKGDPITELYMKISNTNFSNIGFYYKRLFDKTSSYYMLLIDVFSLPEITIKEYELSDYLKKESLAEIKYKKIKSLGDSTHYVSCIKETVKYKTIHSKKDLWINFIRGIFYSFEIFNRIIIKIDTNNPDGISNGIYPGISNKYLLDSNYFDLESDLKIKPSSFITESVKQNFILNMKSLTDLILTNSELS